MTPDLYLHALRQRLEWRRGRALPVRMDTLARHLGDSRGRSDEASIRRRLGQVGITMRPPVIAGTRGVSRAHLALVPEPARASMMGSADPLGHAVAATVVLADHEECGCGFLVDPRGLLVTAFHVVEGDQCLLPGRVTARLADGREARVEIVAGHAVLDFALGWLEPGEWPALPIGTPADLRYGQTVFAVGSPSSPAPDPHGRPSMFHWTLTRGIVSHPCQAQDGIDWIQTDAAIDHGNSGGPLIDEGGRVVGITSRSYEGVRASGLALPIDYLVTDIQEVQRVGREACLAGRTCRACGRWHERRRTSICHTCGATLRH